MGMDMEEEIRDIDKFRLFCHRDSKLYHGRNERIIRYHELSWCKGLAGLFAMILFGFFADKFSYWGILCFLIGVVIYAVIFDRYLKNISKKSESEINELLDSYERTEAFEDVETYRDPFYSEFTHQQLNSYQHYFNKILNSIDVGNLTARKLPHFRFNKKNAIHDYKLIDMISKEARDKDGLSGDALKTIVEQYVWAYDSSEREKEKEKWAIRVKNRKEIDYFPASDKIHELLFQK